MKVYIIGPMTGIEDYNYPAFFEQANKLKRRKGLVVVNPAEIGTEYARFKGKELKDIPRKEFIRESLRGLLRCDYVYMLLGWENSKGAKLEKEIAEQCGMGVLDEEVEVK